jgi:hypothetical protein
MRDELGLTPAQFAERVRAARKAVVYGKHGSGVPLGCSGTGFRCSAAIVSVRV